MIKVLVVDDSKIVCHSVKVIIEQDDEIEVVGFDFNGIESFNESVKHMPDVVLMEIKSLNLMVLMGLS